MWGYMQQYHGGTGWFGGPIMMVLFWVLLIGGIVFLIRFSGKGGDRHFNDKPLDILRERYARGEIDREEFKSRRHDLANH